MSFAIRMGIPEMMQLWTDLSQKHANGTISKKELSLYKKWGKSAVTKNRTKSYNSTVICS